MNKFIFIMNIFCIVFLFTSCSVIGGIFKAGMGVGIFVTVLLVGGIIYFVARSSGNK